MSHLSAAGWHRWRAQDPDEDVHVTTTRWLGPRDGITIHKARRIDRVDIVRSRHFVITTMPRTLVDLADILPWSEYRALADRLPQLHVERIREAQQRAPFRAGAPKVTRLIEADGGHTKSEFERRYLRFCRREGSRCHRR